MADRTLTIPEPDLTTSALSVVITRPVPGAGFRAVVSYTAGGIDHTATIDFATELTGAQRTALSSAMGPVVNAAKTKMGF